MSYELRRVFQGVGIILGLTLFIQLLFWLKTIDPLPSSWYFRVWYESLPLAFMCYLGLKTMIWVLSERRYVGYKDIGIIACVGTVMQWVSTLVFPFVAPFEVHVVIWVLMVCSCSIMWRVSFLPIIQHMKQK